MPSRRRALTAKPGRSSRRYAPSTATCRSSASRATAAPPRRPPRPCSRRRFPTADASAVDLGADALIGEDLEQHRVLEATVEHVDLLDPAGQGLERALHLGDHPGVNDAAVDEPRRLRRRQRANHLAGAAAYGFDVRQENELLGPQGLGHLAGCGVRVDVQRVTLAVDADRGDDGDEPGLDELVDDVGHDLDDLAHAPRVDLRVGAAVDSRADARHLARADEPVVLAGEADGAAALLADEPHDLLVD